MSNPPFVPVPTEQYQCGVCSAVKTGDLFTPNYYIGPVCKSCHEDFRRYGCD